MVTVKLADWSMPFEEVRMVADLTELHDGILQRCSPLVGLVRVNHELIVLLNALVNILLLG